MESVKDVSNIWAVEQNYEPNFNIFNESGDNCYSQLIASKNNLLIVFNINAQTAWKSRDLCDWRKLGYKKGVQYDRGRTIFFLKSSIKENKL